VLSNLLRHSLLTPKVCVLLFTSDWSWKSSLSESQQRLIWRIIRPHPGEINNEVARLAALWCVISYQLHKGLLLNLKLKLNYKNRGKHCTSESWALPVHFKPWKVLRKFLLTNCDAFRDFDMWVWFQTKLTLLLFICCILNIIEAVFHISKASPQLVTGRRDMTY
jgi:hypothetical protein